MKYNFFLVVLCLILGACGPSLPYTNDYPLTGELFRSRGAEFSGKVPEGWFAAPLDSLPSMYKVWLVKQGYAATIHVLELKLDERSRKEIHDRGLSLLAEISIAFHKESGHRPVILDPPKAFTLTGREYCGYEAQENDIPKRVIVFSFQNRFYECAVSPAERAWPAKSLTQLFSTQQTVLSSLVFK